MTRTRRPWWTEMRWWMKLVLSWVLLVAVFLGVMWYQLQTPFQGLVIPVWFKHTPLGMMFITIDIWTHHQFCQTVFYGENRLVTALWFSVEVYTIGALGYVFGRWQR